ncbi:MAG TPA: PTS transporter subunit EIIB [Woeseiaceae bacterium]|nr:PTS transporter subunit EIIB [Woeseiaceae bacterium]
MREWIEALGGAANLRDVGTAAGRLRIEVADPSKVDPAREAPGMRAVAWVAPGIAHVIVDARRLDPARAQAALAAALTR